MSNRWKYAIAWLAIFAIVVAAAAIVVVPVWLIQPFAPQTQGDLQISFLFRSWSPLATLIATFACGLLSAYVWVNSRRWIGKILVVIPLFIALFFTWFARQNHFEWMFNPLAKTSFAPASQADFVADDDMVLAVKIDGDAAA